MKSVRVFLWAGFAVGTVLSVIAQVHSEVKSSTIPVAVNRRSIDFRIILQENNTGSTLISCNVDNATYLVEENQCINNQHLYNECSFLITPSVEPNTSRLILSIDHAVVALRGSAENTQLNSSTCQISSLEVYRGRQQAIEISHQGFSLSDNGTIQIYKNQLAYSFEEYRGELYRMNLSCSGGGLSLPESGCLFFKVSGAANISKAKFNGSVPGTLITINYSSESELVTVTNGKGLATSSLASTTLIIIRDLTTFIINSSTMPPQIKFIDRLTSITLMIVGGVTILISTVMVCAMILLRNGQKCSSVVAQPQNQADNSPAALLSGNFNKNPAYNIDAQPIASAPQEPTYEVIQSDTDRTPQNVICSQNPPYIHLGVRVEESFQAAADAMSPGDYSQNPAYGIHSNLNN